MLRHLLLLFVLHVLIYQSAGSHVHIVNRTAQEGYTITLPCTISQGAGYMYRDWRRGFESRSNHSSTPLFQQVGGTTPDKLPGARGDMDVDTESFNLTITRVQTADHNVIFTCLEYNQSRHKYSYVQLQVQEAQNRTALIVGVSVGALVLLLMVTGVATYSIKKRTAGFTQSSDALGGTEDMSVGFATSSSTVRLYNKQD